VTRIGTPELRIPVDSVKVACQEACPADAISFGNLLDSDSRMTRAKGNVMDSIKAIVGEEEFAKIKVAGLERNYDLLNYIGTRPRTSYLARVKNPNDRMPNAANIGRATIHMH
jgi:molybdopterin-containing oxidoreductase family iron-sulfur binding subunit